MGIESKKLKVKRQKYEAKVKTFKFLLALLTFSFLLLPSFCFAADKAGLVSEGNKLYNKGNIDEALKNYNQALAKAPGEPIINFDIANAFYRKKQYKDAIASYEKSLLSSDKNIEAKANYNIGNCKFRQGRIKEMPDLSGAITDYRHSLDYYKRAMELDPKDKEAKFNHEFVEKLIKKLLEEKASKQQQEKKEGDQGISESGDQEKQKEQQKEQKQEHGVQKQRYEAGGDIAPAQEKEQDKEMSREQARMLLDDFRQQEAQDRRLNDKHRPVKEYDVEKDW